jgi:hypothetical protein
MKRRPDGQREISARAATSPRTPRLAPTRAIGKPDDQALTASWMKRTAASTSESS